FGAGVLAGRGDWLDAAPPYLAGGGASRYVGDATSDLEWSDGAARHEAGTPNVVGAVALAEACRTLVAAGQDRLAATEQALLERLRSGLTGIAGVRELTTFGPDHPRVGIVAFVVGGLDSGQLAETLSARYGIGVRAGLFCAHPLTRRLLTEAGCGDDGTGSAVRASLGLGSTAAHVDRLIAAVAAEVS
ncbi:MAG: aminotransferase class V-fold PLP-dependent enzyme, partial [Micromonosporaceae bacterium]